jgi:hypothetical protein
MLKSVHLYLEGTVAAAMITTLGVISGIATPGRDLKQLDGFLYAASVRRREQERANHHRHDRALSLEAAVDAA